MITIYNNNICVTYDELVDKEVAADEIGKGIISYFNYINYIKSGKIVAARRACRGTAALYTYDELPSFIQDSIKLKYGNDLYRAARGEYIEQFIQNDIHAYHFYSHYKLPNGKSLSDTMIRKYTANANALNAIIAMSNNSSAYRKALQGPARAPRVNGLSSLGAMIKSLLVVQDKFGFSLPSSERSVRRLLTEYKQVGYEAIISKKHANANAAKVIHDEQEAVLRKLLSNWRNLGYAKVAELYNLTADHTGWKRITPQAVGKYDETWTAHTEAGRRGSKEWSNNIGMQVTRRAPSYPLLYWTFDGWEVELLYQDTKVDAKGYSQTTYHNRATVIVVLDPCHKYPLGYHICKNENQASIKSALRNAVKHTRELFGTYHYPAQVQSDNFAKKANRPFYQALTEHYTPARVANAKSKVIEPWFKALNARCQMEHNWSGHGITSIKANQPNSEYLNNTTIKHTFPDYVGLVRQIERIIADMRAEVVAQYQEAYTKLPSTKKNLWTTEQYLWHLGEVKPKTNRLEASGFNIQMKGIEYNYDSFDQDFRLRYFRQDWTTRYDPADMSTILVSDEQGEVKFLLEQKHVQPMALSERAEGDAAALHQVYDYNKQLVATITEQDHKDTEQLIHIMDTYPSTRGVLGKLMIADSKGQHKIHKQLEKKKQELPEIIDYIEIDKYKAREQYYDSKVDFSDYI